MYISLRRYRAPVFDASSSFYVRRRLSEVRSCKGRSGRCWRDESDAPPSSNPLLPLQSSAHVLIPSPVTCSGATCGAALVLVVRDSFSVHVFLAIRRCGAFSRAGARGLQAMVDPGMMHGVDPAWLHQVLTGVCVCRWVGAYVRRHSTVWMCRYWVARKVVIFYDPWQKPLKRRTSSTVRAL